MGETREVLIQLRYARQKIEKIEGELKENPTVASNELWIKINGVIGSLRAAKAELLEGAKP